MAIPKPSENEILDRIHNRIINETPLTAGLESTMIGTILKIIAAEMSSVWNYIEDLYEQSNLLTATGAGLDNFGLIFGIPRKKSVKATTQGLNRAVRFTNNGVSSANIPQGTRVFKRLEPRIAFFTTEGVTINSGADAEVHVAAADPGPSYNVNIGELTQHNVANVSVSVTNILPILNGSDLESDASYRARIKQELIRRVGITRENVSALARSVPGVRDVYLMDYARGAGSFDIVVIPYNFDASSTVVSEVQALLNESVPVGISALAKPPRYRQLDITINIAFNSGVGSRKQEIRERIKSQIASMISNLPVETGSGLGSFSMARIKALAIASSQEIQSAVVQAGLDGAPISSEKEISPGAGERLILRSLTVN